MAKHDLTLSSPRIAQLDLAYHDIDRRRGLYTLMEKRGQVDRVTRDLDVFEAKSVPPQTTRAKLRGEFIKRAQEKRRDFTVDWVHLKLNDQAQRTVLCKDPFRASTSGSSGSSPRCEARARCARCGAQRERASRVRVWGPSIEMSPPVRRRTQHHLALPAVVLGLCAALLAGCGGSSGGRSLDHDVPDERCPGPDGCRPDPDGRGRLRGHAHGDHPRRGPRRRAGDQDADHRHRSGGRRPATCSSSSTSARPGTTATSSTRPSTAGRPPSFPIGVGQVIAGWDAALVGQTVGIAGRHGDPAVARLRRGRATRRQDQRRRHPRVRRRHPGHLPAGLGLGRRLDADQPDHDRPARR